MYINKKIVIFPFFLLLGAAISGCGTESNQTALKQLEKDSCSSLAAPQQVIFESQPSWYQSETLPRHCRVRGTITNSIRFEMRLPAQWNGRFMMAGCGGYCGVLLPDKPGHSNGINEALKRGYVAGE